MNAYGTRIQVQVWCAGCIINEEHGGGVGEKSCCIVLSGVSSICGVARRISVQRMVSPAGVY